MTGMRKRKMLFVYILVIFCLSLSVQAALKLPKGLLIVGYDGLDWSPYFILEEDGDWIKIEEIKNPSHLTWDSESGFIYIKGNDTKYYRYQLDLKILKPLTVFDKGSYTQLRAYSKGVLSVQLLEGKSRDTHILSVERDDSKLTTLVRQSSAQFHPYIRHNQLYYAHVSCRIDCIPLIQEIWQKNLSTRRTKQLTLLNATSYLHSVDNANQYGYISSNQQGFYHLAQLNIITGDLLWLTEGKVTDSFPSISENGDLYFIRRLSSGSRLMKISMQDMLKLKLVEGLSHINYETISLPSSIQKIRYLELSY